MRIGVLGAGAVGGAMAALLARAGHDVEVTARGANLAAIRADGIRMSGPWGDFVSAVDAAETLSHGPGLVIVATKAQDAAAAIEANARLLRGIPVLIVQNGLASVREAAKLLPNSDVSGALALFAASLTEPGLVTITTPGHTYVGGNARDHDVAERFVAGVLGAVMPVSVIPNFVGAQWTKLVVNQINALPAITGLSAQQVIAHPGLRRILTASMRENVRVGVASGIRFASLQGLSDRALRLFARLPLRVGQALPLLLAQRMGDVPNPGSTLQSIRRGSLSEIDYLNGAVVEAATEVRIPVPVNSALVALVHEVERGGFLSPETVIARVLL
jgi:2-dehydropantoate 2-reductase